MRRFCVLNLLFGEMTGVRFDSFGETKILFRIVVSIDSIGTGRKANFLAIFGVHMKGIVFSIVEGHVKLLL